MDALKWLLNACLVIAFMFLGLRAQPSKDKQEDAKPKNSIVLNLLAKF